MADSRERGDVIGNQPKPQWLWIEEYKCGCSTEADRKRDLLGYCGQHGDSRRRLYKLPRLANK